MSNYIQKMKQENYELRKQLKMQAQEIIKEVRNAITRNSKHRVADGSTPWELDKFQLSEDLDLILLDFEGRAEK